MYQNKIRQLHRKLTEKRQKTMIAVETAHDAARAQELRDEWARYSNYVHNQIVEEQTH